METSIFKRMEILFCALIEKLHNIKLWTEIFCVAERTHPVGSTQQMGSMEIMFKCSGKMATKLGRNLSEKPHPLSEYGWTWTVSLLIRSSFIWN